jgi:hypothetical protein
MMMPLQDRPFSGGKLNKWRLVDEARFAQQMRHCLLPPDGQNVDGRRPWAADRRRRGQTGLPSFRRGARNPNRG